MLTREFHRCQHESLIAALTFELLFFYHFILFRSRGSLQRKRMMFSYPCYPVIIQALERSFNSQPSLLVFF